MEALKNRKTAFVILIAVILIMTPLGMKLSLERAVRKVEDGFEKGVKVHSSGTSYVLPSAAEHAEDAVSAAKVLTTVTDDEEALSQQTERLRKARVQLEDAKSRNDTYAALLEVFDAARELSRAKENVTLSATDQDHWVDYYEQLTGALEAAFQEVDKYNASVDEFCDGVLSKFPASLIARLLSVEAPERLGGGS